MPVAKEFVGIPKYQAAEEMIVPGSQFLEIPPHAHAVYRLAAHMQRYHWIADGRIYLISNRGLENRTVVKTAAGQIQGFLNNQECVCIVERFDMRLRGSLVIFITEQNTRKNFITRLVSDPYVQKIVRRNQDFLNFLHKSSRLSAAIKKKLPEPISEKEDAAHTLFTETLIQGRLAWKINQGGLRKVIFAEAVEFITTLQLSMRQSMLLTPDHAEEFFSADVQRICKVKACDPELMAGVLRVVKKMRRILSGRTFFLTISHGDYGYGNILVHPVTGHLAGVIDWDTGRVNDLPGIDYLNLVVQKKRSESGHSVARAFSEASEEIWRKGALDDKDCYAQEFDLTGEPLKIILYACLIRYMSRAAQYPEVFIREQGDYLECLQHLEDLVPL
ncbi:MAG: aminoglycoside phosphotransferase family protein [Desulfobacterales bacterium]|nr:aminoglycoside phosphotransferase family protein [Desulfobacterales bacterium]